jgi:hypothetical protein
MSGECRPIAIANDYLTGIWRDKCDLPRRTLRPDEKGDRSEHRRNAMLAQLQRRRPATIERAILATQADWIDNECTMQQMCFVPAKGELLVIGLEDQGAVAIGGLAA